MSMGIQKMIVNLETQLGNKINIGNKIINLETQTNLEALIFTWKHNY